MYSPYAMVTCQKLIFDPALIDAVLFDLDGTLMDTDDQVVEEAALRLQRLNWPWLYRNARRLVMLAETPANALMTALDIVGLDAPLLGLWKWLRSLRGAREEPDYRLVEGAKAVLIALKVCHKLGVVTTRGREDAEVFLAQHSLCEMFDVVVTREDTWRLKPHPAPIYKAAGLLGVPAKRCAMVGDTVVDVRSARRAGARAVAVTCGFGDRRELERAEADVVLDEISDLTSLL